MLLSGKTLLVTGGTHGIGRAIAIEAARQGADVGVTDLRADDALAGEIAALGRGFFYHEGDVSAPETATRFVSGAAARFGKVDVMVSNAGICPFHAFVDMPVDVLQRTVSVNLLGAYYMCQAAAKQMVDQKTGGALIAISSISALVGGAMQTHYTPTKAGVHSLMQSCAIALGPHKIRCNSVLPGTILTDINKDDLADEAKRRYMEGRIPLGRLGQPDDIAGPVVFLASDMAKYVTGAALLVDGGAFVNLQ